MLDLVLLPLKFLLIAIDLLITIVTLGWVGAINKLTESKPLRSVPVDKDEWHRVDPRYRGNLATTPIPGLLTLYDLSNNAFKTYGNVKCMGTREFLGWKVPGKVKHFGDKIAWKTYSEIGEEAHKFGAALRASGCVPAPSTTTLDKVTTSCRIAIFENTSASWLIACMGAFTQAISVTTIYATLGMDAVVEAVQDNLITVIVCNRKDVGKLVGKASTMTTLKCIVYTDDLVGPDDKIDLPTLPKGLKVVSFDDFVASGDTQEYPPTPPEPDTCAVVMYTSGSTGKPKGVVITHSQVVAASAAINVGLQVEPGKDVYLAYLPLAHIMELMAEFILVALGCTLCYADPKSLTTTGSYPKGALEVFSPTLMAGVPKIWDVIKKGIQAKVAASKPIAQFLVNTAFEWRAFCLKNGFDSPLFKKLVFKKFTTAVGGKLQKGLSGGGPLNSEVQDFIRVAFGIPLVQGYGLTETCAGLAIQALDDLNSGVAGVPIPSCEVKLESTPDVRDKAGQPYLCTDKRDVNGDPVFGRGEILIKGGNVTCGYYMMPEKTKEDFEDSGWFHTGDIGQFTADGSIKVVDRKKNLVKLKGGEYIAMEKMEMTYGNSTFVDAIAGGICCYGDGDMDRPVALMQLSEPVTMKWAKENGVAGDFDTVKKSDALYKAVLADLQTEHTKGGELSHLEKLVAVSLLSNPWTSENGCLTAANKLQRRVVIETFKNEFEEVKKKGIF